MSLRRNSPAAIADEARAAEERGDWKEAARLWRRASGCCLGHGRAARYDESARRARERAARS
jgi:hypothetical protein